MGGLNTIAATDLTPSVGGLDLHPPETASGIEYEVVVLDIAARFGDAEPEFRGFLHKGEFGDVALPFSIRVVAVSVVS